VPKGSPFETQGQGFTLSPSLRAEKQKEKSTTAAARFEAIRTLSARQPGPLLAFTHP
jgi:hypothetical protein